MSAIPPPINGLPKTNAPSTQVVEVQLSEILTPYARVVMDAKPFQELLESVREHGVQDAILLSARKAVLNGNRRVVAAKQAGHTTIRAIVNASIMTEEDELRVVVACDKQSRRDPADTASLVFSFVNNGGCKIGEAAKRLGINATAGTRLQQFTKCAPLIQHLISDKKVPFMCATILWKLPEAQQIAVANKAVADQLTMDEIRELVTPRKEGKPKKVCRFVVGDVNLIVALSVKPDDLKKAVAHILGAIDKAFQSNLSYPEGRKMLDASVALKPK